MHDDHLRDEPGALARRLPAHRRSPTAIDRAALDRAHGFALDAGARRSTAIGAGGSVMNAARGRASSRQRRGGKLWEPSAESVERSTMTRYMRWLAAERAATPSATTRPLWEWSVTELEEFWASIWDFFEVQASAPY